MKLLHRITDVFLYTSLLTACCATGLCMATERLINGASPAIINPLHILVLGSALVVYNTHHIIRWQYRTAGIHRRLRIWYLLFFSAGTVMAVSSLFRLPREILIVSIILGIFAFMYSWPLLPFKQKKRLREFGWLKIIVLAGVWTIVTSVLPILYAHKQISDYPFEILIRFLFIFTLCIVFDIRDMHADQADNITTLPNIVGMKNSYHLINITLVLFAALSFVQYLRYPITERLIGALLTAVITKIVVDYLKKHPSVKAYLGLADGVMMVYALLVLLTPIS